MSQYANQQQHYNGHSSSIPGASGGRGDLGPSSMAQHGQFRLPGGINPQQVAMLQQMAQARGQQGQNPQWSPQQLQMAMSAMQSQGGNGNTQALIQAAMKANSGQAGGGNQQGAPMQIGRHGAVGGQHGAVGGQQGNAHSQAMQQQRMPQLMQPQGNVSSPQQLQAMQARNANPNASSSTWQSQQLQPGSNMAPPPVPGSNQQNGSNYGPPHLAPQQLSLTPLQQQQYATQRNTMISNPQFQALLPQQQQQQLGIMTQHLMRTFAQQNMQSQQIQQVQPDTSYQQQQQLVQAQAQTLSGLAQHMAPNGPASSSSHRDPSPHAHSPTVRHPANTPPSNQPMYPNMAAQNNRAPSPSPSNHSHHSQQHHTPQPLTGRPLGSSSPMSAYPPTPQQGIAPPSHPAYYIGLNGGQNGQQQTNPQAGMAIQAMQQHAQNAQTMLQSGQLVGPSQGGTQNMSQQQHHQVASALGYMNNAGSSQSTTQNVRPVPVRPTLPNIHMSDFPFDWRLLPQISLLNDQKWRSEVQQRNPQLLAAVQSAAAMITSGSVRQEILQRMQQVVFHATRSQAGAVRPPQQPGQLPQQVQQQLGPAGLPGYLPNGQLSPQQLQALPPSEQQRLWAAQQAQGMPVPSQTFGNVRPPPPHLPPSMLPGSPSTSNMPNPSRRHSLSREKQSRERTPSQAAMPPPAWIRSHGTARPPLHTAIDVPAGPSPTPHTVPVKEWETALRLDLPITNISPLPVEEIDEATDPTFGGKLIPMTEKEKQQVGEWLENDKAYAKRMEEHKVKVKRKMMQWAANNDMDTPWWQVRKGEKYRPPGGRLSIIWPADKENMRARLTHKGRKQIRL